LRGLEDVAEEGEGGGRGRRGGRGATGVVASSSDDDDELLPLLLFPPSSPEEPPETIISRSPSLPAGVAGSEGAAAVGDESSSGSSRRSWSAEATRWTRRFEGARITIGCGCDEGEVVFSTAAGFPPASPEAAVRASAAAFPPRTRLARVAV
jgi:hypothetical protein